MVLLINNRTMIEALRKLFSSTQPQPEETEISFKQGFDLTELPIVTFHQGKTKLNFILDTGSNYNTINESVLKRLEYEKLDQMTEAVGVEGNTVVCKFCRITLSCQGNDYSYHYMVRDLDAAFAEIKNESGVNLHGIIGTSFFNDFKAKIDFDKMIASFRKQ